MDHRKYSARRFDFQALFQIGSGLDSWFDWRGETDIAGDEKQAGVSSEKNRENLSRLTREEIGRYA